MVQLSLLGKLHIKHYQALHPVTMCAWVMTSGSRVLHDAGNVFLVEISLTCNIYKVSIVYVEHNLVRLPNRRRGPTRLASGNIPY